MNALEMEQLRCEREHVKYLVLGVMKLCFLVRHYDPDLTLNPRKGKSCLWSWKVATRIILGSVSWPVLNICGGEMLSKRADSSAVN